MRKLVIRAPNNLPLYTHQKLHVLDNIRLFLGFFGLPIVEGTETLPPLPGYTLPSIVLPLDLRDGLDEVLQTLSQHHGLFNIEFSSPTTFSGAGVHPSVLASYICPSLQLLQSIRNLTVPGELVCPELLYTLSALHNLAEISIVSRGAGDGGSRFVELVLSYNYTFQHFPALRTLNIGAQRVCSASLAQLSYRFPSVRIS